MTRGSTPTTADATIRNLPVEKVLALVPAESRIPAAGTLSAQAHIIGTTDNPNANLKFTLAKVMVYDEPIDAIDQVACRPDFAIGCYSGYLKVRDKDAIRSDLEIPADTPPVFLAHASDDRESYGGSISEKVLRSEREICFLTRFLVPSRPFFFNFAAR
jgi:hypothetical protein